MRGTRLRYHEMMLVTFWPQPPSEETNVQPSYFQCVSFAILITSVCVTASSAQEGETSNDLRRERIGLEKQLEKIGADYDKASANRLAAWKQKFEELEKEHREAFAKQYEEVQKKIKTLEQREELLRLRAEARQKGFQAKLEIRGRLEFRTPPMTFFPVPGEQAHWWEVVAGDLQYSLEFNKNAVFLQVAEANRHKTVLLKGVLTGQNRMRVTSIEAVKD